MQIGHAGATRRTIILFQIEVGELQVWVYKRSFEQGDSMGTGTTSDADWACRGDAKNFHFFQIEEGELQIWVYQKKL